MPSPGKAAPAACGRGDLTAGGPGPQRRAAAIFRPPMPPPARRVGLPPCIPAQNSRRPRRPPLALRPLAVRPRSACRRVIASQAAMGAASPQEGITMTTDHDDNPHTSSSTAHVLTELQLYGWRPFQDEPDPRPL